MTNSDNTVNPKIQPVDAKKNILLHDGNAATISGYLYQFHLRLATDAAKYSASALEWEMDFCRRLHQVTSDSIDKRSALKIRRVGSATMRHCKWALVIRRWAGEQVRGLYMYNHLIHNSASDVTVTVTLSRATLSPYCHRRLSTVRTRLCQ